MKDNSVLIEYFNEDNLKLAYFRVTCWPERLVKDRFGIQAFKVNFDKNLSNLSKNIIAGTYKPTVGFKFFEPKSSGTQRTKTLLMIEDAIVYQAISNIIAQRVYPLLAENDKFVFGSVLNPDVQLGIKLLENENPNFFFFKFWKSLFSKFKESVIKSIEEDKATFKFETDITGFFDSIPHYNLLQTLSADFGVEDEILDIFSLCLNTWSGTKENFTPGVGIPQGPLPSFFLANLLLHPLDNKVIDEAYKYYRYMDDIKIYSYLEQELFDVLVKIDNYLKGHGLSINSKKTSIQKIDLDKEDETVKEYKRFSILGGDYSAESQQNIKTEKQFVRNLSSLLDQENDQTGKFDLETEKLTSPEEIIKFWESEIAIVELELPALFVDGSIELKDAKTTDDLDFIRLSAKYGTALQALNEYKKVSSNDMLLKYWLFAMKKYYWRANNYLLTLQHYKDNDLLKIELKELYKFGKNYEWYRYHIMICLTYNFSFVDRELREFYKILKDESSDLVRYSLYCLIIKHSSDYQLLSSLKANIKIEKSQYLKLIVLNYWKHDKKRNDSMNELLKSSGL